MNWNLLWTPIDSQKSKFEILNNDEPVLTKELCASIEKTDKSSWLTFVEASYKFNFESFNEFIMDLEKGVKAKFSFDITDGEEAFAYDDTTELLTFKLELYSSNLTFNISMDERSRQQFASEFRKFLNHTFEYLEKSQTNDYQMSVDS